MFISHEETFTTQEDITTISSHIDYFLNLQVPS